MTPSVVISSEMRRPSSNLERDESVSAKWQQLRQYEEQDMGDLGQADIVNSHQPQQPQQQEGGLKQKQTARGKLEQFKKNSAKRFSTIKSQIYGRYKKSIATEEKSLILELLRLRSVGPRLERRETTKMAVPPTAAMCCPG